MAVLRAEPATSPTSAPTPLPTAAEIMAALRDVAGTWQVADGEGRARLLDRTYEKVEAHDGTVTRVTLTPDAEAIGLTAALPESVVVRARPAGIEPAT